MNKENHTRNQKRMYRIHKLEEKVHSQELLIGKYRLALLDIKEYIDYQWTWDGTGIDDIENIVNKALELEGDKDE